MSGHYSHHIYRKQIAAWLTLFAVALIVVVPLISVSLQKDMMHHHTPIMDEYHIGHKPIQMPEGHAKACDYCVLLVHVPGVQSALTVLICAPMLCLLLQSPQLVIQRKFFFLWLYHHPRAPPQKTIFTYRKHKNGRFNASNSLCFL